MEEQKYRLVTRSDFDGLVCAVLLKEQGLIDDILFVHPKDMQDNKIEISDRDITTNLPYVEGVHLAFDHHYSEILRLKEKKKNHIIDPDAPSTARVVYNYYGGYDTFPDISLEMMEAVDKADSAQFTLDEVLHPEGWNLLNFIMDARTGLGRFRTFSISNYHLMMDLINYCKNHTINQILKLPDVKERVNLYRKHEKLFKEQLNRCSKNVENILVIDFREEDTIYGGNRFIKYALYPNCNVSVQCMWGYKKQNTVFTVGKSIFNRSLSVNIGELMLSYGGGGHANAGTCQIETDNAGTVLNEIIEHLRGK